MNRYRNIINYLLVCMSTNNYQHMNKICKKLNKKEKHNLVKYLFKQENTNIDLINWLYLRIKFYKKNKLIKVLIKNNKNNNILEWYLDILICEYTSKYDNCDNHDNGNHDNDNPYFNLSIKLLKSLKYAYYVNIDAFDIIAAKIKIERFPMLLLEFVNDIDLSENILNNIMKLDISGYFEVSYDKNMEIVMISKLDILKQIKDNERRITYILNNFKFKYIDYDVIKFDECCICLEKPKDIVLSKCNHYSCGKCFFNILDKKTLKISCPICRLQSDGLCELSYGICPS